MPRPRWKTPGAVLAAVVLGVAAWVLVERSAARTREKAEEDRARELATDRLATCLFPDALDAPNLGPTLRASQLAAMRSEREGPARCAAYARALVAERRHAGDDDTRPLDRLLASLEAPDSVTANLTGPVSAWRDDVRAAGLVPHCVDGVSGPAPRPRAETVDSLDRRALVLRAGLPLASLRFAPFFDEATAFVTDAMPGRTAPSYCVYEGGRAQCSELHGAALAAGSAELRPFGTREPSAPPVAVRALVSAGDRARGGLFEVESGERLPLELPRGAYGASASAAGLEVATWSVYPPGVALLHVEGEGRSATSTATPLLFRTSVGDPEYNVGLFWGFFVAKRFTTDAPGLRLRVRQVSGGRVGPEVDVGQVGEAPRIEASGEEPHLQGCRSEGVVTLRVRGWDADYFTFRRTTGRAEPGAGEVTGWSRPTRVDGAGARGALTCHGAEATLLDQRGHVEDGRYEPVVTESRCTPDACRVRTAQTRDVFARSRLVTPRSARDVRVASIGDRVLLVWNAGERGGLRMRLGKLDELARRDDVIVFDDHLEHGAFRPESTLVYFDLRSVADGALLVLGTTEGTFLYLVDGGGALRPVTLE